MIPQRRKTFVLRGRRVGKTAMAKHLLAEYEAQQWNEKHPIGTVVMVRLDGRNSQQRTRTASVAICASSDHPVIWVEGIAGFYHLDCVTAVEPQPEPV